VQQRQRTHGGLTPPALGTVRTAVCRNNDDFSDAQTHAHKSGGRQPAVANIRARWQKHNESCPANNDHRTRSGGRQPAVVFGKRTCRNAAVKSRETAGTMLTSAGAAAPANPRGAYAPRSCIALRTSVGEKTIFPMHKRTLTRAAGVSPPWRTFDRAGKSITKRRFMSGEQRPPDQERRASARRGVRETHLQERRRKVAGDRRHYAHERRCSSAGEPTGGLRPPLLALLERPSAGIMTIFPMHKRTLTRAAGVSPPWRTFERAGKSITNHVRRTTTTGLGAANVSPPWV
jgi:hypothetical protein